MQGIDTLVLFGGSSLAVSANAVPFLEGLEHCTDCQRFHPAEDRAARSRGDERNRKRILLIGDVDIWSNISSKDPASNPLTGILAGKNLQFAIKVFGYTAGFTVKVPNPTPTSISDHQHSVRPGDANILDVLKDLGSVDKTKWRLYGRWDGFEYFEFPSPGFLSFKRGEGYWLITKGSETLTPALHRVGAQDFFPIQLTPVTISLEIHFRTK